MGPVVRREDHPRAARDAVEVVAAAQDATGFPPPQVIPAERVAGWIAARQDAALGVWTARLPSGQPVGHALLELVPTDHPDWPRMGEPWAQALADGRLAQLGGLAVLPGWSGRGLATALVTARLDWARAHAPGLLLVASAWTGSAGSAALVARHGRRVGPSPTTPGCDLWAYR